MAVPVPKQSRIRLLGSSIGHLEDLRSCYVLRYRVIGNSSCAVPHYSALAIRTALTLRAVFRLALRQTEGLIGSILQLLGLDLAVPDHSTLSRRAATLEVPRPCSRSGGPVHRLVDSTGLRLCGPGEWLVEKHGTRKRRSWHKRHIGVDAETGQILASELTTSDVDDASQVEPLLD
jgi:hypothetical protein